MKIKDLPAYLRPREKLLDKGAANLRDAELLAILLRTGTRGKNVLELAKLLLQRYPLHQLPHLNIEDVKKLPGLDIGKSCAILASIELGRRAFLKIDNYLPVLSSPQSALDQLGELVTYKKEHFVALYLNARNQLVLKETVSIGTVNASLVHPREVFVPALEIRAVSVLIAHNHPFGDADPSAEDILVTQRLVKAGELLDIPILDHLIIGKSGYVSLKELGYLD